LCGRVHERLLHSCCCGCLLCGCLLCGRRRQGLRLWGAPRAADCWPVLLLCALLLLLLPW
jgi:hypothetical protein